MRVYSDAAYRDGCAGIAVAGDMGEAWQAVSAVNSMHAEVLALAFATLSAARRGVETVTFRVDSIGLLDLRRLRHRAGHAPACNQVMRLFTTHPGWQLEHIARAGNARANILARRALIMQTGNWQQRQHCLRAQQRELGVAA